jgi:hypothetical protein
MMPSLSAVRLMPSGVMAEEGPRQSCQPREA